MELPKIQIKNAELEILNELLDNIEELKERNLEQLSFRISQNEKSEEYSTADNNWNKQQIQLKNYKKNYLTKIQTLLEKEIERSKM